MINFEWVQIIISSGLTGIILTPLIQYRANCKLEKYKLELQAGFEKIKTENQCRLNSNILIAKEKFESSKAIHKQIATLQKKYTIIERTYWTYEGQSEFTAESKAIPPLVNELLEFISEKRAFIGEELYFDIKSYCESLLEVCSNPMGNCEKHENVFWIFYKILEAIRMN